MPKQVSKKLREMLGDEAAETMVDWLDQRDRHYEELRLETRADMAELRQELHTEIGTLRQELHTEIGTFRQEFGELRQEMRAGFAAMDVKFAALEGKMAERNAELMKWALGFWIASFLGVVGAIYTLSRISH